MKLEERKHGFPLSLYRSPRSPKSECTESGWVNEAQITTRDKMSVAAVTCHTVALSVKRVYQLVKEINWIDIVSWSHTHYLFRTEANDGGKLFAYYSYILYTKHFYCVCVQNHGKHGHTRCNDEWMKQQQWEKKQHRADANTSWK